MISAADFELASTEAYVHAQAFLREYQDSADNFFELKQDAIDNLKRFVAPTGLKVTPVTRLPKKRFGSWLFRTGVNTYQIAIDTNQLRAWERETNLPYDVQYIRSMLHELGHSQVSPRLLNVKELKFAPDAEPVEEEKAWVYAIVFLSILLGEYSLRARGFIPERDDAPKQFI